MLKVLRYVAALVVLWIGVVSCEECKYTGRTWGDIDDPFVFYYCQGNAIKAYCPTGTSYVSNQTVEACIAWEEWDPNCINQVPLTPDTCGPNTYLQSHGYLDPSYFYLCVAEGKMPIQIQCPTGQGFNSGKKYSGCFPWAMWRDLAGCRS